jgi:MFS family permease
MKTAQAKNSHTFSDKSPRLLDHAGDRKRLFLACGLRNFGYGFLSLVLALYLGALGLNPASIGLIFTAALVGSALMTLLLTAYADRIGRRKVLVLGALLMALAGTSFGLFDNPLLLALAALAGSISPSGKEVGPFLSVEQAILSQVTADEKRTTTFAHYNLVGSLAGTLGAAAVALPGWLGLPAFEGYRLLIWGYVALAIVLALLFRGLSPASEVTRIQSVENPVGPCEKAPKRANRLGLHRSRGKVMKLAALFALDAFAGGFVVQGLVSYWFYLRYGLDVQTLAAIFFATNLFTTLSFLAAAPLAKRFGLLNTMVFTHLPSNFLLMLVPLMPSLELAVAILLLRQLLSQLDVPTRQSYTMAIVAPDERSATAGITSVTRNAATALAPLFTGATLAAGVLALGLPFLIAGSLKVVYDLSIWATFRKIKPAEEQKR